jgi:RimJ/RimL family protein N-acetyltransferase
MLPTSWKFRDHYEFRVEEDLNSDPNYQRLIDSLLGGMPPVDSLLSEEEKQLREALKVTTQGLVSFRVGVYFGGELIGFTRAIQISRTILHMAISCVHTEHQRNGIYTELVRAVLEFSKDQGFQIVESHHRATNNPVIIAKLRAGFVIGGMILSETMGSLVRLVYYHNPERRKLMDARSGHTRPEGQLRELFF